MTKLLRLMTAAASAAGLITYGRYRREIGAKREMLDQGSTVAETTAGDIEYAEAGDGDPVLAIHGAGGGYDQGLLIAANVGAGYRVIAPSRFGYLKTPVPVDASPAAQADAHAALLDFLGIHRSIVVAASAGGPSAIELALHFPDRVSALILLVPRTYDPSHSIGVDKSIGSQAVLRLVESSADFLFWIATQIARTSVVRFLGVPPEVEANASDEDREQVTRVIESILPLSSRVRGIAVDSAAEISRWPLERIHVPTLIISAEDDLFDTLPGARFTAEHIKGAELHVLKSGGHLMVGQTAMVRKLIRQFLEAAAQRKHAPRHPASSRGKALEAA